MKVTIISNGTHQIVLKPQTPLEILAIKELQDKVLVSEYHASTQILGESSPNCLVIKPTGEDIKSNSIENRTWLAVIACNEQNKILGLIPAITPSFDILYFIKQHLEADKVELTKQMDILVNESFHTIVTNSIDGEQGISDQEFAVMTVDTYKKW